MILVFGGTTEGRKAVKTLEEAGNPYYYSTRSSEQEVPLLHGQRLTGAMETEKIAAFCRSHDIRLIVDAAHPFAEQLHLNLLSAASEVGASLIRFDRIYPPHTDDIAWCKDYDEAMARLEQQGISRLLCLTGVQTIHRLRPFWEQHECWFRILDREESLRLARKNAFPEDHLAYYEHDDTAALLQQLRPQAILTKESGITGGFCEKVEAARNAGIPVFVIERPAYPPRPALSPLSTLPPPQKPVLVDGEHGLRRAVEQLLPDFYPLKSGLTTGTCATAAALAATVRLVTGEKPSEVIVTLPNGEHIPVPVGYGDDYAFAIKDAGDDPDVTNGLEIRASASDEGEDKSSKNTHIMIEAGEGIGRFTLPGFDYPAGEAAINRVPREMIIHNISTLNTGHSLLPPLPSPLKITLSVPKGEETARKTFNPRLGIEGGISIIGVSGIVKPFSEEAFIESIRKCMKVAVASLSETEDPQERRVVINSGGKSERFVRSLYPTLPRQAFVEYGNYIGETLRMARELGVSRLTLGVMIGKAVKLAAGHLDTHSRRVVMDRLFVARLLTEAGCEADLSHLTLARELWTLVPADRLQALADVIIAHCREHCQPLFPNGQLTILLIAEDGRIFS